MATVTKTQPIHKAFFAHLFDQTGVLTKVDGHIWFLDDATGELTAFEPEMATWTTVLGEVGLANTQQIVDKIRGGTAKIVCTRNQEAA